MTSGILLLAIIVCVVLYAYVDGNFLNWFFTTVEEGSMKFVVKGEDYVRTILNIRGKWMDKNDELIVDGNGKQTDNKKDELTEDDKPPLSFSLFRMLGGLHFIGIPPFFRIHTFKLVTGELLSEQERQDKPFRKWVKTGEPKTTSRLDLKIRTYSAANNVELADGSNVDVIIFSLFEVVDPRRVVFVHKSDFATIAQSAVNSGYVDGIKKYKYSTPNKAKIIEDSGNEVEKEFLGFLHTPKGRGSAFSQGICTYINSGGGKQAEDVKSLEEEYGVRLAETFVYEFQLSEGEVDFNKATRAAEVARLEGEGKINAARAEAEAIRINAEAEATRLKLSLEAARGQHVNADVAMGNIATIRAMESGAARQTWVQTGAVSVGNLFPQQQEQPKPTNPAPEGNKE